MKEFIIIAVMSFFSCSLQAQEKNDTTYKRDDTKAKILFNDQIHDFGHFSRSKHPVQKHTFEFVNEGNKNLYILQAVSGCGCTTPKYTKDPIPPGKKGKVVVHFDSSTQHLGPFSKSVTIYTNDVRSYTRIFVKGVIDE